MSKYYDIKAKDKDSADIYIYKEIDSYSPKDSEYGTSAKGFELELKELGDIKNLDIYINSPGGDVFEGQAIYNILKRKSKTCSITVHVDGLAASIASVIAMAGDTVVMPKNSMMMIHKSSTFIYGNADELEKQADVLKKVDETIKNVYLEHSNDKLDSETLDFMLNAGDTWLTAEECLEYGLCDEVVEEVAIAAKYDKNILNKFNNVPDVFKERKFEDKEIEDLINKVNTISKTW